MALVSVIVPCYNYGHLLAETLDSVLAQTHQQWECIIVDDGSTDTTREVGERYQQLDTRFRYVYQTNAGLSAARNTGLQKARGFYIQLLDADDLLAVRKLEVQVAVLEKAPEIDIVYGDVRYFYHSNPQILSRSFNMQDEEWVMPMNGRGAVIVNALVEGNKLVVNAALIRSSIVERVGEFHPPLRAMEDWDFWLRCAIADAGFKYLPQSDTWSFVRVHDTSMSQNRLNMFWNELTVRQRLDEVLQPSGFAAAHRKNQDYIAYLRGLIGPQLLAKRQWGKGLLTCWQAARTSGQYGYWLRTVLYWLRQAARSGQQE